MIQFFYIKTSKLYAVALLMALMACNTVKVTLDGGGTARVTSHIPEKHILKKIVFAQKGLFEYTSLNVAFKDKKLKAAGFNIALENSDAWAHTGVESMDSYTLLDSITTPAYTAKVFRVTSAHPAFKHLEKEFKVITVSMKQGTIYTNVWHESDFKDNITPEFIAQKLTGINFEVKN